MSGSRDESNAGTFCALVNFFCILFGLSAFSLSPNRSTVTKLCDDIFSTKVRCDDVMIGAAVLVIMTVVDFGGDAVDRIKLIPVELFVGAVISPFLSVDTL